MENWFLKQLHQISTVRVPVPLLYTPTVVSIFAYLVWKICGIFSFAGYRIGYLGDDLYFKAYTCVFVILRFILIFLNCPSFVLISCLTIYEFPFLYSPGRHTPSPSLSNIYQCESNLSINFT